MKGWRTIAFGAIVAALGSVQAADLVTVIPADYSSIAMSVIGVAIMILRGVTNGPVGTK